jgi:hypothetical protein
MMAARDCRWITGRGPLCQLALVAGLVALIVPTAGLACQCVAPASDATLIERVQSSWPAGYASMRAGAYAKALALVESTRVFVPRIRDAASRRCVAAGADNLITAAAAGQRYLTGHHGDAAGARIAAQRAWHTFINCR